jgi:hypothetical protein
MSNHNKKELVNNKTSHEYHSWFLKYNPEKGIRPEFLKHKRKETNYRNYSNKKPRRINREEVEYLPKNNRGNYQKKGQPVFSKKIKQNQNKEEHFKYNYSPKKTQEKESYQHGFTRKIKPQLKNRVEHLKSMGARAVETIE